MSSDKKPWTQFVRPKQEDDCLKSLIDELGSDVHWCFVSKQMKEKHGISARTGKQCRERWNNHLDPGTRKRDWTREEDQIIFNYQQQHGNQWSKLAKFLVGRSDNTIKNHFYATLRRKLRRYNRINKERIDKPIQEIINDKELVKVLMSVPEKESKKIEAEP
jgi:hypothetical protein